MRKKILWLFHRYFNWRLGLIPTLFVGAGVFGINFYEHSLWEALRAWIIACMAIFPISSFMTDFIQKAALKKSAWKSYLVGTSVPTCATLFFHGYGQIRNDTPELFWSIAFPVLITFSTSIALNYLTKRYKNPNIKSLGILDKFLEPIGRIRTQPRS